MRYVSTRGLAPPISFLDAVLAGLAPDGGLYVPNQWPSQLDSDDFRRCCAVEPYSYAATHVLKAFAGEDLAWDDAADLAKAAYDQGFASKAVTPLSQLGPADWLLELFHGPSLAFKDIGMRLIAELYEFALPQRNRRLTVVCATSGDTGGAAVEALKNRERIDLFVLLPAGRVSDVQRRFMSASGAENVHAIEVAGDFDDCQAIVKALFRDASFTQEAELSGVNSINWARIVAQSVYFHIAANTLAAAGPVNFAVPTGNLGDAFAGFAAKKCGAPVGRILLAVNANDILARALGSGRYARAARSLPTLSPAMDIQVASNFERLVFEALGRDADATRALFDGFAQSGAFDVPADALAEIREHVSAAAVDDPRTADALRAAYADGAGPLICPHTAVARAAQDDAALAAPRVTLATAHAAKFPEAVEAATGARPRLPSSAADLMERPERLERLENEAEAVKNFIRERSRACR